MKIILICAGALVLLLLFCFLTGKGKPSNKRSNLEKIACSLFSIFRKNTADVAQAIRTPKVLKEEALQEVEDALKSLEETFKTNQCNLRTVKIKLETETLPKLRDLPGTLTAKAKKAKKQYEDSVNSGTPIEAYKVNAVKFLTYRNQATENIKKAEKNLQKVITVIETSKAEYDGQKIDLEMIKSDLMSMTEIERYELDQSLDRIHSLQGELNTRMNEQQIRDDVERELRNEETISVDWEEAFNSL